MKKSWWPWVLIAVVFCSAQYLGNESGVTKFAYQRTSVTSTATTVSLATITPLTGSPRMIILKSLSNNTDVIRIDPITATSTSLPLSPGESITLPYTKPTISMKSDSGTQNLDNTAIYR